MGLSIVSVFAYPLQSTDWTFRPNTLHLNSDVLALVKETSRVHSHTTPFDSFQVLPAVGPVIITRREDLQTHYTLLTFHASIYPISDTV
jgi:hypothetical protein